MKRNSKSVPVKDFFSNPDCPLSELLQQAESLKNLQSIICQTLAPELRPHCQLVNIQSSLLTLSTHHGNWATKIRYAIPEILEVIHKIPSLANIKTIRVIVIPDSIQKETVKKEKLTLNSSTAKIINDMANSISDPELSACLKRLGSHTAKKSP